MGIQRRKVELKRQERREERQEAAARRVRAARGVSHVCPRCGQERPLSDYLPHPSGGYLVARGCVECRS